MDRLKLILAGGAIGLIVWLLYPPRQLDRDADQSNVVEIMYMGPLGPIRDAMADAVSEFERQSVEAHRRDPSRPIYRVISCQTAAKDPGENPTRFLVSVAGGMPPDVIFFDRYAIAEWAARGAFDPLDDYIAADVSAGRTDAPGREQFYPAAWDEAMYAGKLYGIPASIDDRALLYNVDLFIRAGLVDEQGNARPPQTWEEMIEYSRRLVEFDSGGRMTRAAFIPDYREGWLYHYGWLNDADFVSPDGKRVQLDSPAVVEALQFMKATADAQGGYAPLAAFKASFQGESLDPFFTGKLAMKVEGSWAFDGLMHHAPGLNFAAAPLPRPARLTDKPPLSFSGGWAYAIPSTARNKQAAWEFIRFMTGEQSVRIQMASDKDKYESMGRPYIPYQQPRIAMNEFGYSHYVADNPTIPDRVKRAARLYNDLLPLSRFRPSTVVGQLMWSTQKNAVQSTLYGAQSPAAALAEANDMCQRALDRHLSPPTGSVIRSWTWFFVLYGAMLLIGAAAAFVWHIRHHPSGTLTRRQWPGGIIAASPWLIGFIVFGGGPMLFSLVISFTDYDILNPPRWAGLKNYTLLFSGEDRVLPHALWNTVYMVIAVPLTMAVSLAIALLLNASIRAMPMWRTFFYLPAIVPLVATAVLWVWLLNPDGGLINLILRAFGLPEPLWLQSADWSKPSLILMRLWAAGGGMIMWLAGPKSIPPSLYEAAEVDGASSWQQFWSITIPQLTPYIFFNLIMGLIGTFQSFADAFVMTQGGPVNSTLFYVYHLFNHAFRYGNMGYASAMAWLLLVIVLVLTLIQLRTSRRWVHYESE